MFLWVFQGYSSVFQGCFKDDLRFFQGCMSRLLDVSFMGFHRGKRYFWECFKGFLRKSILKNAFGFI